MNTLEIIIKNGLSIRQIPLKVYTLNEIRHHKEGNKIVYSTLPKHWNYRIFKEKKEGNNNFIFEDETETIKRVYTQNVTTPKNAGFWMCKQVKDTLTSIKWNSKKDNLAPNLKESVNLFLKNNK